MTEDIKLTGFREARHFAQEHRKEAQKRIIGPAFDDNFLSDPPPEVFNSIFALQSQVEEDGSMDYHVYAQRMWNTVFGSPATQQVDAAFQLFENAMIVNLHAIQTERMVYPHVTDRLEALIQARGEQVRELVLWSTGDVKATGYQAGKIDRSGIAERYMRAAFKSSPESARELIRKTRYMVSDNKFGRLADHVQDLMDSGEEDIKLVIIEDSTSNFDKAGQALREKLGEKADLVDIAHIWATYSREGQQEKARAEGNDELMQGFLAKKSRLNAIDSFSELLNERFDEMFEKAHVFVDFDGVIGDNVEMRQHQARVIYQSLINGGLKKGDISIDDLYLLIEKRLGKNPHLP